MSLGHHLTDDLKKAMKAREQLRIDVIRMIKAAIQVKELEIKRELDDAEMTKVMTTLIKQRREAAELYHKANRKELADKEIREISIIEGYLPQALSEEEVLEIIDASIAETKATTLKDMGAVMKVLMGKLAGQAVDGKQLSSLVRTKLQ